MFRPFPEPKPKFLFDLLKANYHPELHADIYNDMPHSEKYSCICINQLNPAHFFSTMTMFLPEFKQKDFVPKHKS